MHDSFFTRQVAAVRSISGATSRNTVKWVAAATLVVVTGGLLFEDSALRYKWPFRSISFDREGPVAPPQPSAAVEVSVAAQPASPPMQVAQAIFSDTAMAPIDYRDSASCQDHIRSIIQDVSESYPLIFNPSTDGIYYARFQGKQDNYVLRCFRINHSGYRLFMSGSGTERLGVSNGLRRFYDAASRAT